MNAHIAAAQTTAMEAGGIMLLFILGIIGFALFMDWLFG